MESHLPCTNPLICSLVWVIGSVNGLAPDHQLNQWWPTVNHSNLNENWIKCIFSYCNCCWCVQCHDALAGDWRQQTPSLISFYSAMASPTLMRFLYNPRTLMAKFQSCHFLYSLFFSFLVSLASVAARWQASWGLSCLVFWPGYRASSLLNREVTAKWPTFGRQHFQMHFVEWKW